MGIGDVRASVIVVAAGGYADIRPPEGEEWVIHNISCSSTCELYVSDGTNSFMVDRVVGGGGWLAYFFHVRYTYYYRVRNPGTESIMVAYDGVVTKG